MTLPVADVRSYRFDSFELDVVGGRLTRDGVVLPLRPKPFRVLQFLVEHPGRLVAKDELLHAVWGRRIVTDGAIAKALAEVRSALDDHAHHCIRTVHGRGYRFERPVVALPAPSPKSHEPDALAPVSAATEMASVSRRPWGHRAVVPTAVAALALTVVAAAVFGVPMRPPASGEARPSALEAVATTARCRATDSGAVAGCEHVRTARYFFGRREPGDLDRAEREFRAALGSNPGLADAWAGLAGIYAVHIAQQGEQRAGRLVELRLAAIHNALVADPDCAEALARYSQHLHQMDRHDEARRTLQRALVLGPDDPVTLSIAAGDALYEGRIDQAVDLQRRATAAGNIAGLHYSNMASYLMIAGRYDEAHAELQALGEFGQQDAEVAQDMAALLVLEGRYQDALRALEQVPEGNRRDALLAIAYTSLGRDADAATAVRRLEGGRDPWDALRLGEVYAQLGDDERAMRWVEEARRRWAANGRQCDGAVKSAVAYSPFLAPRRNRFLAALPDQHG